MKKKERERLNARCNVLFALRVRAITHFEQLHFHSLFIQRALALTLILSLTHTAFLTKTRTI